MVKRLKHDAKTWITIHNSYGPSRHVTQASVYFTFTNIKRTPLLVSLLTFCSPCDLKRCFSVSRNPNNHAMLRETYVYLPLVPLSHVPAIYRWVSHMSYVFSSFRRSILRYLENHDSHVPLFFFIYVPFVYQFKVINLTILSLLLISQLSTNFMNYYLYSKRIKG
jgi:hypothetical protein